MSSIAPPEKKPWYRRRPQGKFLVISILAHVVLILVATYLVVQTFTPRKKNFTAPPAARSNKSLEHKIEVVKKQKAMSAPMQMNRIVTKGMSKVVLPEMPVITTNDPTELTAMSGMGGPGTAFSSGGGGGSGGGAGGLELFGLREKGKGLVGTLYDLTKNRSGSEIDIDYIATISAFTRGGWSPGMLRRFYMAPEQLTAAQIWIPRIQSEGAPRAFKAEKYIKPRRWIIVYRGKVKPPSDGKYRFVGQSDDVMMVRFANRDVLDANLPKYRILGRFRTLKPPERDNAPTWVAGDWLDLKASQTYDIEVLIGEFPGGFFAAQLAVEKQGEDYKKRDDGTLVLPIFRMKDVPSPGRPETARNAPVWTSLALDPDTKTPAKP